MNHSARYWLSLSVTAACLSAPALAVAQPAAAKQADVPTLCPDIVTAFDPLLQSTERAYQKFLASTQAEINSLIAELASAKGAKKQELVRSVEAHEALMLSLKAQLGKTKAELEKAKTKALKACTAALQGPPRKPSLAERCGAFSSGSASASPMHVRLTGDTATERRKAAEVISRELGARFMTTTLDKLVRSSPLEAVTQIENLVAESDKGSLVLLVEEKSDAPPPRAAGRPMDLREPLQAFLGARFARFRGIFLLGSDPGAQSSSPKLPRTAVINATTDGRALATMLCRAQAAPPAKP
jgi:hypothetical protein